MQNSNMIVSYRGGKCTENNSKNMLLLVNDLTIVVACGKSGKKASGLS